MYYLGIDLGGTNIVAGLVDADCKIVETVSCKTNLPRPASEIIDDMASLCAQVIEKAGITKDQVSYVGIGCPGTCNGDTGIVEYSNNLKFDKLPLTEMMTKGLGKPVFVDNDANVAALGEVKFGAAKEYNDAVMLTLGTGVGGGIILDGQVYSGFNYAGAELGHMVIEKDGRQCSCGRRGCIEAYASATAIIRDTRKMAERHPESIINQLVNGDLSKVNGKTAFDAMRAGDKWGKKIVDNYIKYLGEGIINFINIFQPDIILIGGGISKEGDTLLIPLRRYVFKYAYGSKFLKRSKIACATLGNDAGIVGAAML